MSQEKRFSSYKPYGNLLEKYGRNKKAVSVEKALVVAASAPVPAVRPGGEISSVIGKEIKDKKETDTEITINQKDRLEGTFIIGKTGSGKSTLIENKAVQDINNGLGVVLFDPHGQLINNIISRMSKRLEDVVLIDLGSDDFVAPFNLFHCKDATSFKEVVKIVSSFMHVLESFYDISHKNPQMNQYFTNIAKTLVHNPEYTMLDIPRLLDDEVFRKRLVANVPDVHVRWFWERFYEKYRVGVRRGDDISFVVNKLDEFINPAMMPWFGDTKMALNFRQLLDEQKIVFIKLKSEWRSSSKLMGNIIIAQLLDAAHSRSDIDEKYRKDVNIYIDEFQKFASLDLAELFTEARKYKLGLLVANQVREMIDPIIKATCDQAGSIYVFPVSSKNAKDLADNFDCSARPGLPRYEPLKTPVREPIHYMVDPKHGVYLQQNTSQFIERYGRLLVDNATEEKDIQRDSRREWQKYRHDRAIETLRNEYNASIATYTRIPLSIGFITPPSIEVSGDWRNLLKCLNDLFFGAMLCGELGKSLDTITISPSLLSTFLEMFREDRGYLSLQSSYESVARKNGVQIVEADKGAKQLQVELDNLSSYKQDELIALRRKKDAAEKAWYELKVKEYSLHYSAPHVRGHYMSELNNWWKKVRFVTIFDEQWDIFVREGWKVFSDELKPVENGYRGDCCVLEEIVKELRTVGNSGVKLVNMPLFSHDKRTVNGYFFRELQLIVVLERAKKILMNEFRMLPYDMHDIAAPGYDIWETWRDNFDAWPGRVDWMKAVRFERPKEFSSLLEAVKVLEDEIDVYKLKREQDITTQRELFTDLEKRKGEYDSSVSDLERWLHLIMLELANAPIKAPCGVEKEVPTEIQPSEVERIIVEEIKKLEPYTARVKIASGEYTIKTIKSTEYVGVYELKQRIADIQKRNVVAGYLRLRSDVEKEILERQQPPEPVKQETAGAEKPRVENKPAVVAPGAGALVPGASRRKVKKGE